MSLPFIALLILDAQDHGVVETISEIPLDVCKSRTYKYGASITEFPVESGASISDHRRRQPDVVELDGLVSATPVVQASSVDQNQLKGDTLVNQTGSAPAPMQVAHDALLDVHQNNKLVTIVTDYRTHENMALESLEISKSKESGMSFEFHATFKEVRIVATASAALPSAVLKKLKQRPKVKGDTKRAKERAQLMKKIDAGRAASQESIKSLGTSATATGAKVPKA